MDKENKIKRWNNPSYQRIKEAKEFNEYLQISFENNDEVIVSKRVLTPFGSDGIKWEDLEFSPYEIIIPAFPLKLEIPWDKIRVSNDKEFAKYLAEESEEQSRLIGVKVKRMREKKEISSKELAERAGLTAQTISRIEQGHTDVSFATLRKILASMGYSLKDLALQEMELERESSKKSFNTLIKRLNQAGIDSNLLIRKIIPNNLLEALNSQSKEEPVLLLDEVASYISTIYGWSPNQIWGNQSLSIESQAASKAFYKRAINNNKNQIIAYSHYAYYLAKLVLKAFEPKQRIEYPESMEDFKAKYLKLNPNIELDLLLNFVWDMGICVIPLYDSGIFHGACWNVEGRHAIVLKQNTKSHARWIFDLLHELYHVFAHLHDEETSIIETEEPNPFSNSDSTEEQEANSFANQIVFGSKAEEYAELCVTEAKWDIRNLSSSVRAIAKKEKIREDFLSNYLAFRLSYQGENWWSSAMKMQVTDPDPQSIVVDILKQRIKIQKLSPMEQNLLAKSLKNNI